MPKDETMVRTPHQETPQLDDPIAALKVLQHAVARNILDAREAFIVKSRAGAVTGKPLSFSGISRTVEERYGPITRQRVEVIYKRALKALPDPDRTVLLQAWPVLGGSRIPRKADHSRDRGALRTAICLWPASVKFRYDRLHAQAKVPIPRHRLKTAAIMDELESCKALQKDYGITIFPNYRICTVCGPPFKPSAEFSPVGEGRRSSVCKSCKRQWAKEYYLRRTTNGDRLNSTDQIRSGSSSSV